VTVHDRASVAITRLKKATTEMDQRHFLIGITLLFSWLIRKNLLI